MKQNAFSAFFKNAGLWAKHNSPQILVGVGIVGMIGTVVTAVKATTKAKDILETEEEAKGEPLTVQETVKSVWKLYALPAATFAVSTACIVGASATSAKRNAALMTAASMSQTALKTYQEKVVETLGEQEEKKVRQKAREDISEKQNEPQESIYILGGEKVPCVDITGNTFAADPETIRSAVNEVNRRLNDGDDVSLNELYCEIPDAEQTKIGNEIGWWPERGLVTVHFESQLDKRNRPQLVAVYKPYPKYFYER